jgi:D-glycero-beta-D-manno-heptose 1-phosphate adenylyltransferase
MKNLTYVRLIETLVADIISSYEKISDRPITLPIPVFDISEKLFRLRIDAEKLKGKLAHTAGLIIPEKRWMILNNELDQARLNFTIAHELGHWLIDSKSLGLSDSENLLSYPLANREPAIQEGLANYFAGALLMPKFILAGEARRYKGFGNLQLMALASKFGVSINAMSIRLSEIKQELTDLKTPLQLYEPLEYSDMYRATKNRWKYTIVNANYSIIDHNLYRKLRSLKDQSVYLYVIWPREKLEHVETLLEFQCIDGLISTNDIQGKSVAHYLGTDPSVRFVDIENGLWLDNLEESGGDLKNKALVFFPREDEQLTFLKKEILNVNQFIEAPVKLNYRKDAKHFIESAKMIGKRVVITTGCFDLITNAHVRFLKRAKACGDLLIVGIEDDNRVRALKGTFRPVNTIAQRIELMEAFQFVDFTFVISGSPKVELRRFYTKLHSYLKADILAISENDPNMQERKEEIEAGGGMLAIVSQIEEGSTTSLLRQFLGETEFSDIVYISRYKVKDYLLNHDRHWRQLAMPLDLKPKS